MNDKKPKPPTVINLVDDDDIPLTLATPVQEVKKSTPQMQPKPTPPSISQQTQTITTPQQETSTQKQFTCIICSDPAKEPTAARCGHICCYECWVYWLKQKLECPICRKRTREKFLTKLYV